MNLDFLNILKKINLSNIMNHTNKTLGVIKKSIPLYRQVKPYVTHEKSFFKPKESLELIDKIKESKPLKDERTHPKFNDTLTFFK